MAESGTGLISSGKDALSVSSHAPSFERIDAHVHAYQATPALRDFLKQHQMRLVNITAVDKHTRGFEDLDPQHREVADVDRVTEGRVPWVSTFDPQDWENQDFVSRVLGITEKAFSQGAVGLKIYKSVGMEIKSRDGQYLMPDDQVFVPIFAAVEAQNKTLYAHLAEPTACWRPLNPASPHYGYYRAHPEWHYYRHPEYPRKEAILAARDRVLARHPNLRMVGCHLGSIEDDLDELGRHFDLYPNFAVDTAARVPDLMLHPREKVRDFLIKYQDRVLYATDLLLMPWEDPQLKLTKWSAEYERDWKYFATDETVVYFSRPIESFPLPEWLVKPLRRVLGRGSAAGYLGREIRGLALPEPVLRKIFRENALRWVPGILTGK